jgi:preprotein translocase subunit SecE
MATNEDTQEKAAEELASQQLAPAEAGADGVSFEGMAPTNLGIDRYVHAAFFAMGVFGAYLIGKVLAGVWNSLAVWPAAVRAVPSLLAYAEDQRPEFTMVLGAIISAGITLSAYRKPGVRQWSSEVAAELYKVHWPDRELVTNGTIVVIAASVFATVYIGLLDRIWAFITNLVYGA